MSDIILQKAMDEKLRMIRSIFSQEVKEEEFPGPDRDPINSSHNSYYGGVVSGRKFMYSRYMIENTKIEKLEQIIRNQTGLTK